MRQVFVIVLVAVCVLAGSIQAQSRICHYCHKKIEGKWLVVDSNYYHPNHFICSNCLKPITDSLFYVQNDRYYDSDCFVTFKSKKCDFCGKPIVGESVYYDSKTYHQSCYSESVGMHCVVCGNVVLDEFFVDQRGNAVCKRHKDDAKRCSACQSFLSPIFNGSWEKYDDGRIVCEKCLPSAITEIRDANAMMGVVKEELAQSGIVIDNKFKLSFVSIQELNSKFDDFLVDHLGVTLYEKSEMLGGLFTTKKFEIHVLYGLPKSLLKSVLAHELMHVWLFANCPQPMNQQMCEGTCQYAGYLSLMRDNTSEGRFFMEQLQEQEDEIYGDGYRHVLAYVNNVGLKAWLDYLKTSKDAPW